MSHRFQKGGDDNQQNSGGGGPQGPGGSEPQGPPGGSDSSGGGCGKVALIIGGLIVALFVLPCIGYSVYYFGFLSEEERAQMKKEREEEKAAERKKQADTAEKVLEKFEKVGANMPKFETLTQKGERNCPEEWTYDKVGDPPFAGDRFFEQFTAERFAPRYDLAKGWVYTSRDISDVQKALQESPEPEEWEGLGSMDSGNQELLNSKFFAVYYPDFITNPKITDDESFIMGEYRGWLVLMNTEQPSKHCFAHFKALSSRSVRSARDSVLHDEDKKDREILNDDFASNFNKASDDALMRILSGEARPNFQAERGEGKKLPPEVEEALKKAQEKAEGEEDKE